MSSIEKRYVNLDVLSGIKLVRKPNDFDPFDNDPDVLRAELSCGHITDPQSLTNACRIQLDDNKPELRCPECKQQWSYAEVRKLAKLTHEEQQYFEETLAKNAARTTADLKNCPGCDGFIERSDPYNLCVQCTICSENNGEIFEFCWQCMRVWKGKQPRSDKCDNKGCHNKELDLLKKCSKIILKDAGKIKCPAVRACITCGMLINHSTSACKSVTCTRCNTVFCFVCLKLKSECGKTRGYYKPCSRGVAPRQKSIPAWRDQQ